MQIFSSAQLGFDPSGKSLFILNFAERNAIKHVKIRRGISAVKN